MSYCVFQTEKMGKFAVSMICKNASTTFKEYAIDLKVRNRDALVYPFRIGVIQHPRLRLNLSYSYYVDMLRTRPNEMHEDVPRRLLEKYETFVDFILSEYNPHWGPQKPTLCYSDVYTPTHTIRLEDLPSWWPQISDKPLIHKNFSPVLQTSDYRIKDIEEYYKDDFDLWGKAIPYLPNKRLFS